MSLVLNLPESLFKRALERYYELHKNHDGHTKRVMQSEDAVPIFQGFGPNAYLTRSGRVLMDPHGYCEGPIYEATEDELHIYMNFGVRLLKMPELLDILPPRPEKSETCRECQGRKWRPPDEQGREGLWCRKCTAKGWVRLKDE